MNHNLNTHVKDFGKIPCKPFGDISNYGTSGNGHAILYTVEKVSAFLAAHPLEECCNMAISYQKLFRLCEVLDCQPGDLMEYVPDNKTE